MMRIIVALTLMSIITLTSLPTCRSECCSSTIKCTADGKTTNRCYDCTESTPYCGYGKCNVLGCNCDGGCRQGDSTLFCWNIASGCKLVSYYTAPQTQVFNIIDSNNDGRITFNEARAYINASSPGGVQNIEVELQKLDVNKDGFLTFDEIDGY